MNDLFGTTVTCAAIVFPTQLMKLCNHLPISSTLTPDDLIDQHTFLPYYAPFISEERYQQLKTEMTGNNGSSIYMKLGKTASTIKSPVMLRYCHDCIKEDELKCGEVFWHRTHQVEGVKTCPKHHIWLSESDIPYKERKNKHEFITLEKSYNFSKAGNEYPNRIIDFGHLTFISEQTYYLLNTTLSPLGLENLQRFYIAKLQRENLATVTGRIKWKDLIPKYNNYYGEGLLKELNCYIEKDSEDTWLHKVFRKPEVSCHPLRHILVLGFLGETISSMVNQISSYSYEPFGAGPWICLNKAADHYHQPIVISCVITRDYKTEQPVGTFSCSCGFVYSRKGPDKANADRFKIGRIKVFGAVWDRKLTKLAKTDKSLREKARILGVDPKTVKYQFAKTDKGIVNANLSNKKDECREILLELLIEHSEKSITQLRSIRPETFSWLYRNDKEWLKQNQSNTKGSRTYSHKRIDWVQRDKETATQVELIANEILNGNGKPIRVSKNEIGRKLGKVSFLYNNLVKLPRTKDTLNKVVESVEQYQVRRIKHAANCLKRTNPKIYEWQIIRKAGLRKKYALKHKELLHKEVINDETDGWR